MTIIRSLSGEEMLDVLFNLDQYAFHPSPPYQNKEEWMKLVRGRQGVTFHALFEGAKVGGGATSGAAGEAASEAAVCGAASTGMTQNVRGKLFSASGVWGVATLPGARRKGYCRQVMASLLAAERQSGKVFSNLYPFRESFYERLGYCTFLYPMIARLKPAALLPLSKKELGGEVELKLISEAYPDYRDYLQNMIQIVHGMAYFTIGDASAAQRNRQWVALAKVDGAVEGLMLYSLQGEEISRFNFRAIRFYYRTNRARCLLLEWIARHVDQADRVEIWLPAFERPETWLSDLEIKLESQERAPMGRVLDVAGIGGMQVGDGSFTARISDPLCPFNDGVWRFESAEGRLRVEKAHHADCDLSIQALTGLVFGTHDPQDFSLRGWGNPSPGLQVVLRQMFSPKMPFLHEYF
jgi:predicted acetyltransferase